MEAVVQNHKNTLTLEDTALNKILAWKSFSLYGLWIIVLGYLGISGWFGYTNQIWLSPPAHFVLFIIERISIATVLLTIIGLTHTAIKMLTRFSLEQNLRFDVYAAVTEVVSQALARHLPEYQRLTTMIAVGEELVRPAEQMSKRAARLQLSLQQLFPGLGLAEAIDKIVRNALQAGDVADNVKNVEAILTRIESEGAGNVVQLEQRPSA
ncbi:MAG: hypothetical protein V4668_01430 [Patescibacteria group bacterium]